MIKVCAVVVTFNRVKILKECLKHLLSQSYKLSRIIVIDNNSSDGTPSYLASLNNPIVKYARLNKNVGGSGGFNIGAKLAFEHSNCKYIWMMDDDTLPTKNSLYALIKASMKVHGHFGFLSSNVRSLDDIPVNVPNVTTDWTKYLPSGLIKVHQGSFVSLFYPKEIVGKLGLPIKQMFIWGDDCEYTNRISKKYECYFVPDSIIVHNSYVVHNNSKMAETIFNSKRPKFYKYAYRNYLYNARKFKGWTGFLDRLARDIIRLIQTPFLSKDKRMKRFYYVLNGIIHGLFFQPRIEFPSLNDKHNKNVK